MPHGITSSRTALSAIHKAFVKWAPCGETSSVAPCTHLACAQMGDPNASIPTPQPVYTRPMFGAFGRSVENSAVSFVSAAAQDAGIGDALGLAKTTVAVANTRSISKADMVHGLEFASVPSPWPPKSRVARRSSLFADATSQRSRDRDQLGLELVAQVDTSPSSSVVAAP